MNVSYSALGGLPAYQLDMVVNDADIPDIVDYLSATYGNHKP